ncbi:MAG: FAD-dependent oxidoreductase [Pseudomonadota bacterium]
MSEANAATTAHDVVIVGAGLAGLTAAYLLQKAGRSPLILEGADRVGGRIHSLWEEWREDRVAVGDLGPSWVWPPYQPTVSRWLEELAVKTFEQFNTGDAVVELQPGQPPQRHRLPGQHGMVRLHGGPQALIDALLARVSPDAVQLNERVHGVTRKNGVLHLQSRNSAADTETEFAAEHVIMAAPLRVLADSVQWNGLLSEAEMGMLRSASTWMATQAKVVVRYKHPFWRDRKLSGRVASHIGPLVEIHDHCGIDAGKSAALFGFVGWSHTQRRAHQTQLKDEIIAQLVRCFGTEAEQYSHIEIADWARNDLICAPTDLETPPAHPDLMPDAIRQCFLENRLQFGCSETASSSPGLIEGALDAGERAARQAMSAMAQAV